MKALRCISVILAVLLLLPLASVASAEGGSSITLKYPYGVCEFRFYKIASLSEELSPTLSKPFDEYTDSVSMLSTLAGLDADETRTLATTLEAIIYRDKIAETFKDTTDEKGVLEWKDVDDGIYLILGEQTSDENYSYIPSPLLVSMPIIADDGELDRQVEVEHNKVQKLPHGDDHTFYSVKKIWLDNGAENVRPVSISVHLLCDGAVYDTVTLNSENEWKYEWNMLSSEHNWTAVENVVPDGYSLSVEKKQTGIILVNTYDNPPPPPPPPPYLPPTGQLWWPVPILTVIGIVLIAVGCSFRRLGKE